MYICIPHLYILSASMHICKSFKSYPRPWVHPESRHSPHVSCPNSTLVLHRLFSLASKFEDKTDCGDQVQDLGKQEQWSAYVHTNGLLFCLFPLISRFCCSLTCWKAPLSLALPFTVCNKLCTFSQLFWNTPGQVLRIIKSSSILQLVCSFSSEPVSFSWGIKFWVTFSCGQFLSSPSARIMKLRSLSLSPLFATYYSL